MNFNNSRTTRINLQLAFLAILAAGLLANIALAHGGEEHVIGIVTQVSDTSITVKTTAGKIIQVSLDAKTIYTRADQPIKRDDVKVGDRIVIHAKEVNEKLTAHTVAVGGAKPKAP